MKQLHHRFGFGILGILTTLMIACGGGGGGGGSSEPPAPPAPVATSLTAGAASITNGSSTTLTPIFSGGTGVITPGNTTVTSGVAITVTPTTTTTYTLTVTNAAGTTATTTTSVTVVAAPVATSLTAGAASITNGSSTTLTPIFSGGTGVITPGNTTVTSGVTITVTPTTTTTYTLTVTNALGATASTSTSITVIYSNKTLSYIDPTNGTYRWIKNISLSTSSHLVLDLVTTDTQLISGIAFTMSIDTTKALWSKVSTSDSYFVQNGTVFNIGASTPIFYSNSASTTTTLTAAVAQKGSAGISVNGSSTVLARIAIDPLNTGTAGTINLTPIRAQINVQGISNPSNITITAGTLTLN